MAKLLRTILLFTGFSVILLGLYVGYQMWRYELFKTPTYDTQAPVMPVMNSSIKIMMFSKTNSFRHIEAIPAAEKLFQQFAGKNKWDLFITENGAVHSQDILNNFDLLIWNNVTGDVLTLEQRAALKKYMLGGGKLLALHGTGGNEQYDWAWFPKHLIAAQFIGHPMFPQFREAKLNIENRSHPATEHFDQTKPWLEEWYSFSNSPRENVEVLISVDESEYDVPESLKMGKDHPLVWHHKVGEGVVFFTALGHLGEAYEDQDYQLMLEQASHWLLSK